MQGLENVYHLLNSPNPLFNYTKIKTKKVMLYSKRQLKIPNFFFWNWAAMFFHNTKFMDVTHNNLRWAIALVFHIRRILAKFGSSTIIDSLLEYSKQV